MLVLYVGFELLEIIFIFFLDIEGLVVGFVVLFVFLVGVVFFWDIVVENSIIKVFKWE